MRHRFHPGASHDRTLLLFAGWGMDDAPFLELLGPHDTLVVWDYADLSPLPEAILGDRPLHLIAWSMGVWAATQTLPRERLASATAVNGTPWPIDATRGIPPALFDATLANLSEAGIARFRRRMCGAAALGEFLRHAPQRDADDLRSELQALSSAIRTRQERPFAWDRAYACADDRIFPPATMRAAFPDVRLLPGAHWAPEVFRALLEGRAP